MRLPHPVYGLYERRLTSLLSREDVPHHIGVILDGNRRWARAFGEPASAGHRRGADKIAEVLEWSDEVGVSVVTLWMLSTDNLKRPASELAELVTIISDAVCALAESGRWRLRVVGDLELLPAEARDRLRAAEAATEGVDGISVNVAIGYGGRHEIVEAVKCLVQERIEAGTAAEDLADEITAEAIERHLYTKGQPDPDLLIRTSGEQRLSGFLLWQSAHSEFYFCEAHWPDFRRVDFLRALRAYAARERRLGR